MRATHHQHKDTFECRTDKDENSCTEHNRRGDLLYQLKTRLPEHWNRNENQIYVCGNVRGEGNPDNRLGYSGLTDIYSRGRLANEERLIKGSLASGIRIYLPVFV